MRVRRKRRSNFHQTLALRKSTNARTRGMVCRPGRIRAVIGCGSGSWQCDSTGTSLPSFTASSPRKSPKRTRPAPAKREVEQEVGAVGADRSLHRHQDPLALLEHRPLREAREAAELQAIVSHQIGSLRRHAMAFQISRAAGDDASDFAEANCDQLTIAERPYPDRDVNLVGDRIDAVIAHRQIDLISGNWSMNCGSSRASRCLANAVPLLIRRCPRGRPWTEATSASAASTAARMLLA